MSRRRKSKKNLNWIEYTPADPDETPQFVVKLGKKDEPYPQEIQKKIQLQYEKMKNGEQFDDIEYPMHDERCILLRIIKEEEKGTYRELLGKWAVTDFVGVQWDGRAKDCDPPTIPW